MKNIFTDSKVNLGHQKELDIAKGLAIIFMVWVHVNETYQSPTIEGGVYNRIIEFIGSPPAAPVFMLLLGLGIVYSRKSTAETLFKRGIILVVVGYILNILRDFIPYLLLSEVYSDASYIKEGWDLIWGIDILQFAGLAFIFFSVIKKFNVSNTNLFIIWCGFATSNILLRGISFDNSIVNNFFRLIWGTDDYSWFPFLTWISFPICGYLFGQLLIRCTNRAILYKKVLIITGTLSIPLWIYSYVNNVRFGAFGELYQTEYYHHDIIGNVVLCTFALFCISICYFISKHVPETIQKAMTRWSKNTNSIYCIHMIIIGYLMLLIEEVSLMPLQIFVLTIFIFGLTDLICIFIGKIKQKKVIEEPKSDSMNIGYGYLDIKEV